MRRRRAHDIRAAACPFEDQVTGAVRQIDVVAGAAVQDVAASIAEQPVIAGPAVQIVCPVAGLCCTNRLNAEVPLSPDRLIPRLP